MRASPAGVFWLAAAFGGAIVARACPSQQITCCQSVADQRHAQRGDVAVVSPVVVSGTLVAEVEIVGFLFQPPSIVLPRGASVRWENEDPSDHTATATGAMPLFDSGLLAPQAAYEHSFEMTGNFAYYCAIHLDMQGWVSVRRPGDATGDQSVNIADFSILATHFNQPGQSYASGDFNLSGTTDIADFSILAANFNQPEATEPGHIIPEPAPISLALLGIGGMCRRRN